MSKKKKGGDRSEPRTTADKPSQIKEEKEEKEKQEEQVKQEKQEETTKTTRGTAKLPEGQEVAGSESVGPSMARTEEESRIDTGSSVGNREQEEEKSPATIISELEEENSELKDQLLRRQADYENFRKRMQREKEDAVRYANQMLLLDLVPVLDDFERAIKSSENSKDFDAFHSGIEIIEKQLTSMLEKNWGLSRFESFGEAFNPEKHQAIAMEERDEPDHSVVLEDYQKGYYLHDRVLRPAKVKVSQPKAEPKDNLATSDT